MSDPRHYRDDNTEGYTQAQLDALNAELTGRLDGIEPGSDEWHETVGRHADEVARLTPPTATLAARALRAIPSEARSEQSRSNGRRGGRPVDPRRRRHCPRCAAQPGYLCVGPLGGTLRTYHVER